MSISGFLLESLCRTMSTRNQLSDTCLREMMLAHQSVDLARIRLDDLKQFSMTTTLSRNDGWNHGVSDSSSVQPYTFDYSTIRRSASGGSISGASASTGSCSSNDSFTGCSWWSPTSSPVCQSPPEPRNIWLQRLASEVPIQPSLGTVDDRSKVGGKGRNIDGATRLEPEFSRYKTELCRTFEENGTCKYGEKCQFAHGRGELRLVLRHPKYKTERCKTYHSTGLCPYGPRCHFIHNDFERQLSDANLLMIEKRKLLFLVAEALASQKTATRSSETIEGNIDAIAHDQKTVAFGSHLSCSEVPVSYPKTTTGIQDPRACSSFSRLQNGEMHPPPAIFPSERNILSGSEMAALAVKLAMLSQNTKKLNL